MSISEARVNHILIHEDIEGLIGLGAPEDEYASEASQIAQAISMLSADERTSEKIRAIVALVWSESFGLSAQDITLRTEAIVRTVSRIEQVLT
jgi:hypothetical protein